MNRIARKTGLLLLLGGLVTVALSTCAKSDPIKQLPEKALIVDVRTAGEYNKGHFPGAKLIPIHQLKSRIAEFGPKDRPVVVYCHSGTRSGVARNMLERAGYTQAINGGGLEDMMRLAAGSVPDGGAKP